MKKKILSIVFVLMAVCLSAFCFTACGNNDGDWGDGGETEGLSYVKIADKDEYSVREFGDAEDSEIVIPSTYKGKPVTKIENEAFKECEFITSVVIPDSVKSIGASAFAKCSSLKRVMLGNSVISIGEKAFSDCYDLVEVVNKSEHVTIEKEETDNGYLGYYALAVFNSEDEYINKFTTDANGVKTFVDEEDKILVDYDKDKTEITISSDITKIREYAFKGTTIISVYYTGTIDDWAEIERENSNSNPLQNGAKLYINNELVTEVNISTATKISDYAFGNYDELTNLIIGDSVIKLGTEAFYDCDEMVSVIIGSGIVDIGGGTFKNCDKLSNLEIANSETNVDYSAFISCPIKTVKASSLVIKKLPDDEIESVVITGGSSIANSMLSGCDTLTSVVIGNSVTNIGSNAFNECTSLTSVTIGNGVTSIGNFAFSDCSSLTNIIIPNRVTSIEMGVFSNCSSLRSIIIPDRVESIGYYSFSDCTSLRSVVIPKSLAEIDSSAFRSCGSLQKIYYKGTKSDWRKVDIGTLGNENIINATLYYYIENEADVPATGNYWQYVDGVPTAW